jgi:uncharacterized protein YkwD
MQSFRFQQIVVFVLWLVAVAVAGAQSSPEYDAGAEARIFAELNQARAQQGVPALQLDAKLTDAARRHSSLMVQHEKLSHQFPGEPPVFERLRSVGVFFTGSAENAGVNSDLENMTAMFLASPGHRANMLNPAYNSAGIGVVRRGRSYWITEDFAEELVSLSAEEAAARTAAAVQRKWSRGHPEPLKRVGLPHLHALACETAARGKLQPAPVIYGNRVARQVFAFSTDDPSSLAQQIDRALGLTRVQNYAVAACTPQESGDHAHYWIVIAFF